jgi:hypothetical protein
MGRHVVFKLWICGVALFLPINLVYVTTFLAGVCGGTLPLLWMYMMLSNFSETDYAN